MIAALGSWLRGVAERPPQCVAYVPVGHSNVDPRAYRMIKAATGGEIVVMIRDVTPLEFPQHQRPGMSDRFRRMLDVVQDQADPVLYNSKDTQQRAETRMRSGRPIPEALVAPLGDRPSRTRYPQLLRLNFP